MANGHIGRRPRKPGTDSPRPGADADAVGDAPVGGAVVGGAVVASDAETPGEGEVAPVPPDGDAEASVEPPEPVQPVRTRVVAAATATSRDASQTFIDPPGSR
ncbi:hypothetical protein GCM10010381_47030 [Streptomyces xantholiticus]|nr:hypothetical protein GCM10010381_47030 [Streptomyces xantholiticus]